MSFNELLLNTARHNPSAFKLPKGLPKEAKGLTLGNLTAYLSAVQDAMQDIVAYAHADLQQKTQTEAKAYFGEFAHEMESLNKHWQSCLLGKESIQQLLPHVERIRKLPAAWRRRVPSVTIEEESMVEEHFLNLDLKHIRPNFKFLLLSMAIIFHVLAGFLQLGLVPALAEMALPALPFPELLVTAMARFFTNTLRINPQVIERIWLWSWKLEAPPQHVSLAAPVSWNPTTLLLATTPGKLGLSQASKNLNLGVRAQLSTYWSFFSPWSIFDASIIWVSEWGKFTGMGVITQPWVAYLVFAMIIISVGSQMVASAESSKHAAELVTKKLRWAMWYLFMGPQLLVDPTLQYLADKFLALPDSVRRQATSKNFVTIDDQIQQLREATKTISDKLKSIKDIKKMLNSNT